MRFDIRYSVRTLLRSPKFTLIAIVTLALGIGINSAIFTVMNTVILKPLPYPEPDQLVMIWERHMAIGKEQDSVAPLNYLDWRSRNDAFQDLAAFRYSGFTLTGGEYPEQVGSLVTTANLFKVLGVQTMIGRTFTEEEVRRDDRVVVLGHQFWQNRFGGDRSLIGKAIILDGSPFTVIGVMPPDFVFPDGQPRIETYSPLVFHPGDLRGRRFHSLTVIGRLKEDTTIESASANLNAIARAISAQDQTSNPQAKIVGAHDELVQDVRLGILVLFGSVGFVLLIACANVANLLLVRASVRRREFAVRSCLGASRWRVIRQLLTESLLLSIASGIAGTLFAWWTLDVFVHFSPRDLPRMDQIALDANVFLFVTAVSILTGIAFGIIPALQLTQHRITETIKESSFGISGAQRNYGKSLIIVCEVALSVILIAGAALMAQTILNLKRLDHGFRPENVLTMQIFLSHEKYPIDSAQFRPREKGVTPPERVSKPAAFFDDLFTRIRNIPGVQAAGAVTALPLNQIGIDYDMPVVVEGKPAPKPGEEPQADFRVVSPGYLRAMSIRLLQGRDFAEYDDGGAADVMIINDAMAKQMFAGKNPLGQRVILYGRPREIVGVIGSVRHYGFKQSARAEMWVPYKQMQFGGMTLAIRSTVDSLSLARSIRQAVHSIDPHQPIYRERTMEQLLSESVAEPRFIALLLAAFATLALTLALIGVYSVMSYSVSQRRHEIGIRMAVGANRGNVLRMIMSQGSVLTLIGIVVGIIGAAALSRVMQNLVYGVSSTDFVTFGSTSILLMVSALIATYLPARRASSINPIAALRYE